MTQTPPPHTLTRLRRMLDRLEQTPDDPPDLATLSDVAALSPYHVHRLFRACCGVTPHRYGQLLRLKQAAWRLAFRPNSTVTAIALDAGYDTPDAFSRAFRQRFGLAPSRFRAVPDWTAAARSLTPLTLARHRLGRIPMPTLSDVTVVTTAPVPVAVLEHHGDPATLGDSIRRFIDWRRAVRLPPAVSATYTVFPCDPAATPPQDFRLDLCCATPGPVAANPQGVRAGLIPGGRRARLRVIGGDDALEVAALFLYRDWLPASGETPGDAPLYCQRLRFFPDVPEAEAELDLYLPLR